MGWIFQYRVDFYEGLRARLDAAGIDLQVVHGQATGSIGHSKDHVVLPWATQIENRVFTVAGKELWWQPALRALRGADLVIVEQASSRLVNYPLLAVQLAGRTKLALWGHGIYTMARRFGGAGEAIKKQLTQRAHWFFAYNDLVRRVLVEQGVDPDRITDVRNAIDTTSLAAAHDRLNPDLVAGLRAELGITSRHVAVYCGAFYPQKRLGFLLVAAQLVRQQVEDFHVVLIGDGRDRPLVERAAAEHDWVHWVGQRFGADRVPYFAISQVQLMPGGVGLAVLDSFALHVPIVTSATGEHGPEIDYLVDGVNGMIVEDHEDPSVFAAAVVAVLTDEAVLATLVEGCEGGRLTYTVDDMVERFATGIERALATPRKSRRGPLTRPAVQRARRAP